MEFVSKISRILGDLQGWMLLVIAAATTLRIAKEGVSYQQGDGREKKEAMDSIKSTLYMGGGVFALIWFAGYVMKAMK